MSYFTVEAVGLVRLTKSIFYNIERDDVFIIQQTVKETHFYNRWQIILGKLYITAKQENI